MLGGGYFTAQNKVLPGSYINFVSSSAVGTTVSDRGVVAMAAELNWGASGIITIDSEVLLTGILKTVGYEYTADETKVIREVMRHARKLLLYRLNGDGVKASNTYATAKYAGTRGNDIKVAISANADDASKWDVTTYLGTVVVDKQVAVANAAALADSDFVVWKDSATLAATSGLTMTGGTNSTVTGTQHSAFLSAIESESYNILTTTVTDSTTQALYVAFTKRMIEQAGVKIQCVLYNNAADHEGIINVATAANLVPWVAGAEAGCEVNKTITNMVYDGEYEIATTYTQSALETAIEEGKLVFHKVGDTHRVLRDINSLTTVTAEKNAEFKNNQTVRVISQIGNDVAAIFNNGYLGKVANDVTGRVAFWSALVNYFRRLEQIRAIEGFDPDTDVVVEPGETKNSVCVKTQISIVNCMEILYMTVYVL